jgi:hypothetical protein
MMDWIGSLRLREHTPIRVVLSLSRTTRIIGLSLMAGGAYLALMVWAISPFLVAIPALIGLLGALLASLERELVFDREAGVLRVSQRALGMGHETVVPLFHLRAVVIVARSSGGAVLPGSMSSRYIAYLDRRVGEAIYLDESRRCAALLSMAEAIADVAELRLEYDAMSQASD